ncbi:hypothetical protein C4K15_6222 [Pseudomonas chlororaphis subsp. aurantiaca]|nr:hypothetical protein C4K15_6222 [Pseudomonas chlororaphis subsp. aurantiaca]
MRAEDRRDPSGRSQPSAAATKRQSHPYKERPAFHRECWPFI